jgi:TPR repeat protein
VRLVTSLLIALSLMVIPPMAVPSGVLANDVPVPQTYGDAMRWYRKAAESGDAKAMFYLALSIEQGLRADADGGEALTWYRRSASAGFPLAQFKLGQLHQFGQLLARDAEVARRWYALAAEQGLADAQFNLAVMMETGEGGEIDGARALALYVQSAAGGIPEAFLNMAGLLAQGELVEQDLVEALKWLNLAEQAGLTQGAPMAAAIRQLLNPVEIRDAAARAQRWRTSNPEVELAR